MTEESVRQRSFVRIMSVVVAILGLVFGPLAAGAAADDERIVTEAEAFVDGDGDHDIEHTFEIHDLDSPVVDPGNFAFAHAQRCTGCQAVAISFQIVLVQQPVEILKPENFAESLNEECTGCDAAAGAYQFVVGRGEPIRLTPAGHRQLGEVRGEVARLEGSRLRGPAIVAQADALADKVRAILKNEVKPAEQGVPVVIDDRRFRSGNDDPSEQSATTVMAAA